MYEYLKILFVCEGILLCNHHYNIYIWDIMKVSNSELQRLKSRTIWTMTSRVPQEQKQTPWPLVRKQTIPTE
jgi:hypothetical protein